MLALRFRVGVRVGVRAGVGVRVRVRAGVGVRVRPRTGELAVQQVRRRSTAQLLDARLVLESPHGPGQE